MPKRHLALPSRGLDPNDALAIAQDAEAAGWHGVWLSEVLNLDVLAVAAAIAARTNRITIGTAIVPTSTRSAPLLAMAAWTIGRLAPGRFSLGLGVSTPTLVEEVHDRGVPDPVANAAGTLEVVRRAIRGERVEHAEQPAVHGFKLADPGEPVPVLLAALGPRMTSLAVTSADGLILNLLPQQAAIDRAHLAVDKAGPDYPTFMLVRTIVDPTDAEEFKLRREVAGYLRTPAYRRVAESSGLPLPTGFDGLESLDEAARALPDETFAALTVVGDPAACLAALTELDDGGVTPLIVPAGGDAAMARTIEALRPDPDAGGVR